MTTPDNLDQDQKRGDHLVVALSFSAIVLVELLISLLFPAYAFSWKSTVFIIGNAALFIIWIVTAVNLWKMTFETYNGLTVAGPVLMALANIVWFATWGSIHYSAVINAFVK